MIKNNSSIKSLAPGGRFIYNEVEYIVLEQVEDGTLCIHSKPIFDKLPFIINKKAAGKDREFDWKDSFIRTCLNDYAKTFDKGVLIPMIIDLTTRCGDAALGTCEDLISLLTYKQLQKYRDIVSKLDTPYWLCTADDLWNKSVCICYSTLFGYLGYQGTITLPSCPKFSAANVIPICTFSPSVTVEIRGTGLKEVKLTKTYLSDFLEKYPNALLKGNGMPPICPDTLGYFKPKCCESSCDCIKCWNTPMEE